MWPENEYNKKSKDKSINSVKYVSRRQGLLLLLIQKFTYVKYPDMHTHTHTIQGVSLHYNIKLILYIWHIYSFSSILPSNNI